MSPSRDRELHDAVENAFRYSTAHAGRRSTAGGGSCDSRESNRLSFLKFDHRMTLDDAAITAVMPYVNVLYCRPSPEGEVHALVHVPSVSLTVPLRITAVPHVHPYLLGGSVSRRWLLPKALGLGWQAIAAPCSNTLSVSRLV